MFHTFLKKFTFAAVVATVSCAVTGVFAVEAPKVDSAKAGQMMEKKGEMMKDGQMMKDQMMEKKDQMMKDGKKPVAPQEETSEDSDEAATDDTEE